MSGAGRPSRAAGRWRVFLRRFGRRGSERGPRAPRVVPAEARRSVSSPALSTEPTSNSSPPRIGPDARPRTEAPRAAMTSAPAPSPGGCPSCGVPYLPSRTPGGWGCPVCGRHPPVGGPPSGAASTSSGPTAETGPTGDRRQEELLAAWMIGATIPCPRCHRPLRRVGVGAFACPACGQRSALAEVGAHRGGAPEPARADERTIVDRLGHALEIGSERTVGGERGHDRA